MYLAVRVLTVQVLTAQVPPAQRRYAWLENAKAGPAYIALLAGAAAHEQHLFVQVGEVVVTADMLPKGCLGLQLQTRLNDQVVQSSCH